MVQYRSEAWPESSNCWTICDHSYCNRTQPLKALLERARYAYNKSAKLARLRKLVTRVDRGLISYETRSLPELRRFCEQRGITVPRKSYSRKTEIIELLEREDDVCTFDRFLELPAELRLRVYEYYLQLASGHLMHYTVTMPPLARTSRQLHTEVLPLVYKEHRVKTRMEHEWRPSRFVISRETERFFAKAPEEVLKSVKSLLLTGLAVNRDSRCYTNVQFNIDLPIRGTDFQVTMRNRPDKECEIALYKKIEPMVREVVEGMKVEGGMQVRRTDAEAFRQLFYEIEHMRL